MIFRKAFTATLVALSGTLIVTAAYAAKILSTNTSLKVADISIENIDDTSNTQTWVLFDAAVTGISHNCSQTDGWWIMGGNQAAVDSMRATAVAAKLADRSVRVMWINGNSGATSCAGGGTSGAPVIRGLMIK